MPSEGPKLAGAGASDSSFGTVPWSATSNITAEDGNRADVVAGAGTSQYLIASSFGFAIPSGATIDGIVVEVKKQNASAGLSSVVDARIRIVKDGVVGSTDKSSGSEWPGIYTWVSHGGVSELWGESWTETDINDSGFGVAVAATLTGGKVAANSQVDAIRITVHYTAAATGKPTHTMHYGRLRRN